MGVCVCLESDGRKFCQICGASIFPQTWDCGEVAFPTLYRACCFNIFFQTWRREPREEDWSIPLKYGALVRELSLSPYKVNAVLHPRLFDWMPVSASILFPSVKVARMDLRYLRTPFISHGLIDLTVMVLDSADMPEISVSSLRTVAGFLARLETFRLDGALTVDRSRRSILEFIRSLRNVRTMVISPFALIPAVFRAASEIPSLIRISVMECGRDHDGLSRVDHFGVPLFSPLPLSAPTPFASLRHAALQTNRTVHVPRIIFQRGFPFRSLVSLWIRFVGDPDIPRSQAKRLLDGLVASCRALKSLTLRFCGRCGSKETTMWQGIEPLEWGDIQSFLLFQVLEDFDIDDTLPLRLGVTDIEVIAANGYRLRRLWLNPFPRVWQSQTAQNMALPLDSLLGLARSCGELRVLGIFVRADERVREGALVNVPRFRSLAEFSVGWSYARPLRRSRGTQEVARLLSLMFGPGVRLVTCTGYDKDTIGNWVCSYMRASGDVFGGSSLMLSWSFAWNSLWAMGMILRDG